MSLVALMGKSTAYFNMSTFIVMESQERQFFNSFHKDSNSPPLFHCQLQLLEILQSPIPLSANRTCEIDWLVNMND